MSDSSLLYGNAVLVGDETPRFEELASVLSFNVHMTEEALAKKKGWPFYEFDEVWFYCEPSEQGVVAHWRAHGA